MVSERRIPNPPSVGEVGGGERHNSHDEGEGSACEVRIIMHMQGNHNAVGEQQKVPQHNMRKSPPEQMLELVRDGQHQTTNLHANASDKQQQVNANVPLLSSSSSRSTTTSHNEPHSASRFNATDDDERGSIGGTNKQKHHNGGNPTSKDTKKMDSNTNCFIPRHMLTIANRLASSTRCDAANTADDDEERRSSLDEEENESSSDSSDADDDEGTRLLSSASVDVSASEDEADSRVEDAQKPFGRMDANGTSHSDDEDDMSTSSHISQQQLADDVAKGKNASRGFSASAKGNNNFYPPTHMMRIAQRMANSFSPNDMDGRSSMQQQQRGSMEVSDGTGTEIDDVVKLNDMSLGTAVAASSNDRKDGDDIDGNPGQSSSAVGHNNETNSEDRGNDQQQHTNAISTQANNVALENNRGKSMQTLRIFESARRMVYEGDHDAGKESNNAASSGDAAVATNAASNDRGGNGDNDGEAPSVQHHFTTQHPGMRLEKYVDGEEMLLQEIRMKYPVGDIAAKNVAEERGAVASETEGDIDAVTEKQLDDSSSNPSTFDKARQALQRNFASAIQEEDQTVEGSTNDDNEKTIGEEERMETARTSAHDAESSVNPAEQGKPSSLPAGAISSERHLTLWPEFLCHLFSMLHDPNYADIISWQVPTVDEPDDTVGGGIRGIGKIVVHNPNALQDSVLGKYFHHCNYEIFQHQLNYFGFKKRVHGGCQKKGKFSPCSYIHESLSEDVGSLFTIKRRNPTTSSRGNSSIRNTLLEAAAQQEENIDATMQQDEHHTDYATDANRGESGTMQSKEVDSAQDPTNINEQQHQLSEMWEKVKSHKRRRVEQQKDPQQHDASETDQDDNCNETREHDSSESDANIHHDDKDGDGDDKDDTPQVRNDSRSNSQELPIERWSESQINNTTSLPQLHSIRSRLKSLLECVEAKIGNELVKQALEKYELKDENNDGKSERKVALMTSTKDACCPLCLSTSSNIDGDGTSFNEQAMVTCPICEQSNCCKYCQAVCQTCENVCCLDCTIECQGCGNGAFCTDCGSAAGGLCRSCSENSSHRNRRGRGRKKRMRAKGSGAKRKRKSSVLAALPEVLIEEDLPEVSIENAQCQLANHLGVNDVLFGRSSLARSHAGNARFRSFIQQQKNKYRLASSKKDCIQNMVVRWRRSGRFLRQEENGCFYEVGDDKVKDRIRSTLGNVWKEDFCYPVNQEHQQNEMPEDNLHSPPPLTRQVGFDRDSTARDGEGGPPPPLVRVSGDQEPTPRYAPPPPIVRLAGDQEPTPRIQDPSAHSFRNMDPIMAQLLPAANERPNPVRNHPQRNQVHHLNGRNLVHNPLQNNTLVPLAPNNLAQDPQSHYLRFVGPGQINDTPPQNHVRHVFTIKQVGDVGFNICDDPHNKSLTKICNVQRHSIAQAYGLHDGDIVVPPVIRSSRIQQGHEVTRDWFVEKCQQLPLAFHVFRPYGGRDERIDGMVQQMVNGNGHVLRHINYSIHRLVIHESDWLGFDIGQKALGSIKYDIKRKDIICRPMPDGRVLADTYDWIMQLLQQPRRPLVFELVRIHTIKANEESLLHKLMQQANHTAQPSHYRAPQQSIQPHPPRHPRHQPMHSNETNSHHIMRHGHRAKPFQQQEMHMNTVNYPAPSLQQDHNRIQRPSTTIPDEVVDLTVTEENGADVDPRIEPEPQQAQQHPSESSHQQHQVSPEPNCAVGGSASDGQLADPADLLGEAALNCDISEAMKLLCSDQQLQEEVEPNPVQYAHAAKMPNNCYNNASGGISEQQSKTTEQQMRRNHGSKDTDEVLAPTILHAVSETTNDGGTPDQRTQTAEALPNATSGDQSKTSDQQVTPKALAHEALAVVVLDVSIEANAKATNEGKSPSAISSEVRQAAAAFSNAYVNGYPKALAAVAKLVNMAVKMATVEAGRAAVEGNSIASRSCSSNIKKNAEDAFAKAYAEGCSNALEAVSQAVAEVKVAGGYRSWCLAKVAHKEARAAKAKEEREREAAKAESTAERGDFAAPGLDNHVEHTATEEKAEPIAKSFDDKQDLGRCSGDPLPKPVGQQPLPECCDDPTTADEEVSGEDKTKGDDSPERNDCTAVPENEGMASDAPVPPSAASESDNDNAGENTSNFVEKDAPNSVSDRVSEGDKNGGDPTENKTLSVRAEVSAEKEGMASDAPVPSSNATESENHNGAPNSLIDSEALQTDTTAQLSSDSSDNGTLNINETTRGSPSEPTHGQLLQPPPAPGNDTPSSKECHRDDRANLTTEDNKQSQPAKKQLTTEEIQGMVAKLKILPPKERKQDGRGCWLCNVDGCKTQAKKDEMCKKHHRWFTLSGRETKEPPDLSEGTSPFHECVISKTPPMAASSIVGHYNIGGKVSKIFMDDEAGKFRPFSGEIKSYDREEGLYRIVYEDGDEEELLEEDLEGIIVREKKKKDAVSKKKDATAQRKRKAGDADEDASKAKSAKKAKSDKSAKKASVHNKKKAKEATAVHKKKQKDTAVHKKGRASKQKKTPSPLLTGMLTYSEQDGKRRHLIQGEWKSDKSCAQKFELSRDLSPDEDLKTLPMSGTFNGSFVYACKVGDSKLVMSDMVKDIDVELRFSSKEDEPDTFNVKGKGVNRFGKFKLYGTATKRPDSGLNSDDFGLTINSPSYNVRLRKKYFAKTATPGPPQNERPPSSPEDNDSTQLPRPSKMHYTGVLSLRGKLVKDDCDAGAMQKIMGIWAPSLETLDAEGSGGLCNRFEYTLNRILSGESSTNMPQSGRYTGWFEMDSKKIKEKDLSIDFQDNRSGFYNLHGMGSNVFGKYRISGTMGLDGAVTIFRHYLPTLG